MTITNRFSTYRQRAEKWEKFRGTRGRTFRGVAGNEGAARNEPCIVSVLKRTRRPSRRQLGLRASHVPGNPYSGDSGCRVNINAYFISYYAIARDMHTGERTHRKIPWAPQERVREDAPALLHIFRREAGNLWKKVSCFWETDFIKYFPKC